MFYIGNGPTNILFNKQKTNKYFIEDYAVNDNDENSHISILSKIVIENSTILDVGCADGKFGYILFQKKNAALFGIEKNSDAVSQVRNTCMYKDVYQFDLEGKNENDSELKRYAENGIVYDYVIMSDIFEHLQNPTEVLLKTAKNLKTGGKVLVSVPNIAHADIWLHLVNGIFNYTDSGILDNTHLKFFTKNSFFQWILDINNYFKDICFDCEFIGTTNAESDFIQTVQKESNLLYKFVSSIPDYDAVQLLFVLTKLDPTEKTPNIEAFLSAPQDDISKKLFEIFNKADELTYLQKEKEQIEVGWRETIESEKKLAQEVQRVLGEWNKTFEYAKNLEDQNKTILGEWNKLNEYAKNLSDENQKKLEECKKKDEIAKTFELENTKLILEAEKTNLELHKLQEQNLQLSDNITLLKIEMNKANEALSAIRNTTGYKVYHKLFGKK
jgi:2-polyprenyl-3-methyl-5-hydroxy-6-metoxy-1,4-benzoquinol methylase